MCKVDKERKLTILIPCYNEEGGVGLVIDDIPFELLTSKGYTVEVLVVDNNSTDNTSVVAKQKGARVVHEPKKGKGNAILRGFKELSVDTDFVVMLDGDNTYKAFEIHRMLEPLETGFGDVIVGSRLSGKLKDGSLRFSNRVVNWAFTFMVRHLYQTNITDVLTGYFAWKKSVIDDLIPHLKSEGFTIEMEMMTKMVKLGHSVFSVPITYGKRKGETKIESFNDGAKIFKMFLSNIFWKPSNINSK